MFETDTRRHFVGEVDSVDGNHLRVEGYPFVYDSETGLFVKIQPQRTCVFSNDNTISITILPPDFDLAHAGYHRAGRDFVFGDDQNRSLEMGAFSRS